MIPKTERLVITFHTTTEAMAMERLCKDLGAPGRLIPVPRQISAGCGLAWCADTQYEDELTQRMAAGGIRPQGIHRCLV